MNTKRRDSRDIWVPALIVLVVILVTLLVARAARASWDSDGPVLERLDGDEVVVTWASPDPYAGLVGVVYFASSGKEKKVALEYVGLVDGVATWRGVLPGLLVGELHAVGGSLDSRRRPGVPFAIGGLPAGWFGVALPVVMR